MMRGLRELKGENELIGIELEMTGWWKGKGTAEL